jgi:iron complex outermembrane recepter protein
MRLKSQTIIFRTTLLASTLMTSAALAQATPAASGGGLEEIVVTAQKRDESLQKVPISVQAIGAQKLQELRINSADDYIKFLPNISVQKSGPGFSPVYIRGIASGENNNHSASLPSVGTYLDEQPITTIQGALDVYLYDIARIEALAGPQGTLYGASSQSGTIKIVTNKPELGKFKAGYDVEVNKIGKGGVGFSGAAFANIPVSDTIAARVVAWYDRDAGYIDNVPGSLTFPTSGATITNAALVKNDYNKVDTYGARAALKIDLNDSWTVTPQVMAQQQKTKGGFVYDPTVGDLQVRRFYPEDAKDRWLQAALTVEGKLGNFNLTYAGSYLVRNDEIAQDYSDYSFFYDSLFGSGAYITDDAGNPLANPSQYIRGKDGYAKMSHELRLASPAESAFRVIGGLFYQRQRHNITQKYTIDGLGNDITIRGQTDVLWLTQQKRIDRDYGAFGEASLDISDKLTATAGVRVYRYDNSLIGFFGLSSNYSSRTGEAACFRAEPSVPDSPCTNVDKSTKKTGAIYKGNLTYKLDDDKLVYATYSKGFRPGGINRRGSLPPYRPDFVNNYELGWKTSWLDNRLRINGALYMLKWKDIQLSFLGANGLTEIVNAGDATVKGIEADISVKPADGFTASLAFSYNDAKLDKNFCNSVDPTFSCTLPAPDGSDNFISAAKDTRLPTTPKFKGSLTLRYEHDAGLGRVHYQLAATNQSEAFADLRDSDRAVTGVLRARSSLDLAIGLTTDRWRIEAFVNNVGDNRGDVRKSTSCATGVCSRVYTVPTQPRTFGIKFGQDF